MNYAMNTECDRTVLRSDHRYRIHTLTHTHTSCSHASKQRWWRGFPRGRCSASQVDIDQDIDIIEITEIEIIGERSHPQTAALSSSSSSSVPLATTATCLPPVTCLYTT